MDDGNINFERGSTVLEDLGINGFVRRMKVRRWLLAVVPIVWVIANNLIFLIERPEYAASLELTEPSDLTAHSGGGIQTTGGASSLLGSIVGNAGSDDPLFSAYLESWTSSWFASRLATDPAIMHQLFASRWTPGGWRRPSGFFYDLRQGLKALIGIPRREWQAPSTDDVLDYLQSNVVVDSSRAKVIAKVTVRAADPKIAAALLSTGHRLITQNLSGMFRKRTQGHVDYLVGKLSTVQVADYREALMRELEDQEKMLMLTSSDSDFAAQPLGMHVFNAPVSPSVGAVLLESFLFAILVYACLILLADRLGLPFEVFRWEHLRGAPLLRAAERFRRSDA